MIPLLTSSPFVPLFLVIYRSRADIYLSRFLPFTEPTRHWTCHAEVQRTVGDESIQHPSWSSLGRSWCVLPFFLSLPTLHFCVSISSSNLVLTLFLPRFLLLPSLCDSPRTNQQIEETASKSRRSTWSTRRSSELRRLMLTERRICRK